MISLWLLGSPGAGKSSLLARARLASPWHFIDQDRELVRLADALGLSLDGGHQELVAPLRAQATATTWAPLPALRVARVPLVFEVTGDRPDLLARQVEIGRAAGYREVGVGVRTPLDICLAHNRARSRVVPEDIIRRCHASFEHHLAAGTYASILDDFAVADDPAFDLAAWIPRV